MSARTRDLLLIESELDTRTLLEEIHNQLIPEFDWLGEWKPAFAIVTTQHRRSVTTRYLQPFLMAGSGASITTIFKVRMRAATTPFMAAVRNHFASYYRDMLLAKPPKISKGVKS